MPIVLLIHISKLLIYCIFNLIVCCLALIYHIMKGERKGIRKFSISYGAGGGIRTHKGLAQRILSPQRMPFRHTRIYKIFVFELVAFANSAIPLYLSGELRFELRSQLRPRGLVSITKNYFAVKVFIYFLYILYHIFYKKSNKIFYIKHISI